MPNILNRDFSGGWAPDSDPTNSPPNVQIRADNLELEDKGILSLRQGAAIQTALSGGGSVESLYSVELDGAQSVLSATANAVYDDGVGLGISVPSGYDTAFDSTDGHALLANATTKSKYDGTTVRNWGIATPLEAPDVDASALESLTIATFTQAAAEFTADEGTIAYITGQDGVASAALKLTPDGTTGRGEITYDFSAAANLLEFSGSLGGQFDLFEFWFWDDQPTQFLSLQIMFGCDTQTDHFEENGYLYQFGSGLVPVGLTQPEIEQAKEEIKTRAAEPTPEEPAEPPPPAPPPSGPRDPYGERPERRRR